MWVKKCKNNWRLGRSLSEKERRSLVSTQCEGLAKGGDFAQGHHKATTGLGVDGFHAKLPLDLSDECHERIVMILHEVESAGQWPTNASTTMSFLIPNITTSERPPALLQPWLRGGNGQGPRAQLNGRHNIAWEMFVRSLLAVLNEWVGNRP